MERGLEVEPGLQSQLNGAGIDIVAPAGTFCIFHVLLVHSSRPNTSGRPRRLMIYTHHPRSHPAPLDVRNGPMRLFESPWEMEYLRLKLRGEYNDTFSAPVYPSDATAPPQMHQGTTAKPKL